MKRLILALLLMSVVLLVPGCAARETPVPAPTSVPVPAPTPTPTPTPPPAAEFQVISLSINPMETTVGEIVSITAVVKNIGGSEGTYAVILSVDGVTVEAKETALITPGSSEVVTFSLIKDVFGTYEIGVGGLKSTLLVKEEAGPVVEKEDQLPPVVENIEIKYDDGTSNGAHAIGMKGKGHVVHFSPPVLPFRIDAIRIYGRLYGTSYEILMAEIEVWDDNFDVLYSCEKPHTIFAPEPDWVTIDIPGVIVGGDFYVFVFTNSPEEGGIAVDFDSSVANTHSEVTWERKIVDWYLTIPKEEVNWMIRVVQGSVLPSTSEEAPPETPEKGLIAYIQGKTEEKQEWLHWGTLGTSRSQLDLELRGTESQERSTVPIVSYKWDFGDGETAEGEYVRHTYYTGSWNLTLTVYDDEGNSASETLKVEVRG